MTCLRKIESFSSQMLILLSVFLTAELFVLYGTASYYDGLPLVTETEWVYDENQKEHYQKPYAADQAGYYSHPLLPETHLNYIGYHYLQPLFYPEKLQLTEGHYFVFTGACRSNIPHLNRDDEDPAFILG